MMTRPSSLNNGRTKAPASCTAALMALIPVFMVNALPKMDRIKGLSVQAKNPGFSRRADRDLRSRGCPSAAPKSKPRPRFGDVPGDLFLQLVDRIEFLFAAKPIAKNQFQLFAV